MLRVGMHINHIYDASVLLKEIEIISTSPTDQTLTVNLNISILYFLSRDKARGVRVTLVTFV